MPIISGAQISITLPDEITVLVNGEPMDQTEAWTDSLRIEAKNGYLKYEIVSAYRYSSQIQTKINIPQFFPLSQVYRQIIFYYAMLNDEKARECEQIFVYPFYEEASLPAWISCSYHSPGIYKLKINRWQTTPAPAAPTPEEKYLYNQIIQNFLEKMSESNHIPDDVFEKVADQNGITVSRLRKIYQNVKLWHMTE